MSMDDTIAGISTAIGNGGISIIRVSGSNALKVFKKIFIGNNKYIESHKIYYGKIIDGSNTILDEVLVSVMLEPKTYTCEDIIEINCHGGNATTNRILEEVLKHNVRLAFPGEFTKRAFLNGRIDLSQAESVISLINSKTELSRSASIKQLSGNLSNKIKDYRLKLLTLIAHIEASIDYPEHEEETQNLLNIESVCSDLIEKITILMNTFEKGKIIKEGIETVILGKPNVGKSSLLNEFLQEERAIVTNIEGTTRDTISEYVNINNILLKLTDTAGIRKTSDIIEEIGIKRSKESAMKSDLILMMIDNSVELSIEDLNILEDIKNKKIIIVLNKCDLPTKIDESILLDYVDKKYILSISIEEKFGLDKLEEAITNMFFNGNINKNEVIITIARHKNSLNSSLNSLNLALNSILNSFSEEIVAIDLQDAYSYLGEILGETVDDEVLDMIFSEFCLGK